MSKRIKNRRGATLAEIMVSVALVSVMIVMALSFTQFITQRTKANAANDAVLQDRQKTESVLESWVDILVSQGAVFSVDEGDTGLLIASAGEEEYTLRFTSGRVTATLPNDKELNLHTETVTEINFDIMKNGDDFLLFCTVISENAYSGGESSCTLCVNPRVGERAGG